MRVLLIILNFYLIEPITTLLLLNFLTLLSMKDVICYYSALVIWLLGVLNKFPGLLSLVYNLSLCNADVSILQSYLLGIPSKNSQPLPICSLLFTTSYFAEAAYLTTFMPDFNTWRHQNEYNINQKACPHIFHLLIFMILTFKDFYIHYCTAQQWWWSWSTLSGFRRSRCDYGWAKR